MMRIGRFLLNAIPSAAPVVDELKGLIVNKKESFMPKLNKLKKEFGGSVLSEATVDKVYGGMRDITAMTYEPSLLDKDEGIRFRGYTIPECQQLLPKASCVDKHNHKIKGTEPLPEAMLWLLMTGEIPTPAQAHALNKELQRRGNVKEHGGEMDKSMIAGAKNLIQSLPKGMHPMTQFSIGILYLQTESKFAAAYEKGTANKGNYWEYVLEDSLDCISRSPQIAAMIYRKMVTGKADIPPLNPDLDWAGNFSQQMGVKGVHTPSAAKNPVSTTPTAIDESDSEFFDMMRLYLTMHADHEGGNVSAHATMLVGSALSDPYLSLSAGINGLAGPLHGLANQETLKFLFDMKKKCQETNIDMRNPDQLKEMISKITWDLLTNTKHVVPGYGHAVLRKTDPRFTCFRDFAARHFPDDELFMLVDAIFQVMPGILTKFGKVKNPFPNVDAHSGVLLQHYGVIEEEYYTVLFGLSRQLGVMSGLVWERLLGKPIERPKSITSDALFKKFGI